MHYNCAPGDRDRDEMLIFASGCCLKSSLQHRIAAQLIALIVAVDAPTKSTINNEDACDL